MKIQFRNPRVFTFLLTLLLLGGVANHAWAKVTYHILSLPMTTKQLNGDNHQAGTLVDFRTNVRVEVLRCVSNTLTVGLPTEYKSPLATNYRYYTSNAIVRTGPSQLYGYNNTTYYFYNISNGTDNTTDNEDYGDGSNGDENTPNSDAVVAELRYSPGAACSDNIDIYVTYDVKASPDIDLSATLNTSTGLVSASKEYNIHLKDRMVVLNQKRQNRPGAVLDGQYDSPQLASDAFSWITSAGIGNGDGYRHFIFRFGGNDPYNVTIYTAYDKNTTFRQTGQDNFFTTDVKDKDKYLRKDVFKEYRGASFFRLMSANMDDKNMWLSSDADIQWQEGGARDNAVRKVVPGYYKGPNDNKSTLYEMSPIFNSFAILNHKSGEGWTLAGSKMNTGSNEWQPSTSGQIQYMDYRDNGNNITVIYKADASACKVDVYEVKKYIFRVKTPFGSNVDATIKWSDYAKDESITTSLIPDELRRKYTSFTGNFYADAEHNTAVTTFAEAQTKCSKDEDGKYVIYVDYTVLSSLPFTAITSANRTTGYTTATWYQMTDKDSSGKKIKWDATNSVFKNNGDAKDYTLESDFAFIGDPYELRIINRKLTVDNRRNVFVGSSSRTTNDDLTILNDPGDGTEGEGFKWEIPYDAISGNFVLREFKSSNAYWNWDTGEGNNIKYSTSASTRIKVMALPKIDYVYHIVKNNDGDIAAKATESQDVGIQLQYSSIPEIIRSPFIHPTLLDDEDGESKITYYYTLADARAKTNAKTNASYNPGDDGYDIYVRYDLNATYKAYINGSTSFNVRLNGEYIYYDASSESIKSSTTLGDNSDGKYNWILGGSDPYAMTVQNVGNDNNYVAVADWATGTISWSESEPTSKFIIKGTSNASVYEVMAATGDGTDAATTYYNIGRADANTVKVYSNGTYAHGYSQLRFQLIATSAVNVTYHLIDIKNNTELLSVQTRQPSTDAPSFPPEYRSPLVETYSYWSSLNDAKNRSGDPRTTVGATGDIWVTYTANNLVDMSGRTMYLMKFALGDQFRQEDGSDGLLAPMSEFTGDDAAKKYKYQAVYPYCNGDCNFFVYGQEQYDEQQQGAASTRTRWAWYVESVNNDPYHVKIRSRQQETYPAGSGNDYNAYFRTYKPNDYSEVVTTLAWPGISGEQGTEYMVLGSAGQFRLVTSDAIDDGSTNVRRAVNSFEQYWKTWNTIRLKVLGDKDAVAKQSDPNTVPATPAAPTAAAASKDNRTYLTEDMGWHSYEQWAYAIRWNDYNKAGDKNKKGWEALEHWYQTVKMGEGYFDFVPTTIDPVLILLDQHGWEVMRKPLPSSPTDPDRYEKYEAIGLYDSPMVKEYAFWKTAKKRTGFHQYYLLSDRIGGEDFTSTSLTNLPPYDSENVKDAKGNLLDQYVTYIVKDEYAQSYNPSGKAGEPFLIEQGSHFVKNDNNAIATENVPTLGGMSQYIIENAANLTTEGSKKNELWYVKPNADIDIEMGYHDEAKFPTGYAHEWDSKTPNAYEDSKYSALKAAVYVKETTEYKNASADDKKKLTDKYGEFSFSNGFDPYNIQISSVSNVEKFFVTNATTAEVHEGSILGDGTSNSLGARQAVKDTLVGGWDNRTLQMTNATFMAVQDKNGNMQLMPRFDQEKRLKDFSALVHTDDAEETKTHTKLYRPLVYNYHIIDNSGQEALRYQGGGDLVPQTPAWFKSPLAKDYKYYKNLTKDGDVYTEVKNKTDISAKEITESLEGAAPTGYDVYVRYSYDESADNMGILKGKWLTMDVNENDAQYTTVSVTAGIYSGTKPETVDGSAKKWQWKFLANSQTNPDPYAVSLYNRNNTPGEPTAVNSKTKFALLNWYNGTSVDANAYTLAVHGLGNYEYQFVNGASMNTTTAATTAEETAVKSTSCSYTNTDAKIELNDDVSHTYTYKVYTNDGNFAVSAEQDYSTVAGNDYVPVLPEEIKSPLLNMDQFRYYDKAHFTFGASQNIESTDTIGKALNNLYGIYDDIVIVRYTPYNLKNTEYKVPNVKTVVDSKVARGETSNDAALDINNELLYNIFWHEDEIMKEYEGSIKSDSNEELHSEDAYVWKFEGNDPYSIKIKHNESGKYAVGAAALADGATSTFMLLPSTDSEWQYGVLQVTGTTGNSAQRLTGHGETLTANASTEPTKFIIFGLSTHTVIYHLVIANIGSKVNIPYSEKDQNGNWKSGFSPSDNNTKPISGSTQRDLTTGSPAGATYQLGTTINGLTYCVNQGHITLGDSLKVPDALKRPNCKYFYYVEGVYTNEDCSRTIPYGTDGTHIDALDGQYRGLQITQMGKEPELLGKTVLINVEYQFNDGLPTNNGSDFVTDPSQKKWFTWETSDDKLAQYTGAAGFKMLEGHESHYTNDFLWSPVGDPYGFKMYNRYEYKTNGATTHVMTTASGPSAATDGDRTLLLGTDDNKAVYELFAGDTDGYFFVRPMLNNDVAIYNNNGTMELSSTNATEYTFGLSMELLKPYYDRAGYVGGLTPEGKTKYEEAGANPMAIQEIVYDDANIVPFTPGYYRLHSQPDIKDLPQRYLSGYTHKTELTSPIPMHFYEKKGVTTTFEALGSGFTTTAATQGQLPIVAPEYDPASIFHITGTLNGSNNALSTATMSTQGLNVIEDHMGTGTATSFTLMDIGGAVLLIHDNATPTTNRKYFCFDQRDAAKIYDIQWKNDTPTDYAKWCLEPANNMGLYIETHSGGEEETLTDLWYYSSYCVPFDLMIADKYGTDKDHSSNAYTCVSTESTWPTTDAEARVGLHPKPISKYTKGVEAYGDLRYRKDAQGNILKDENNNNVLNDYFVPAGTPVLFSTKNAKEYIKATIPTTSPSTSISTIFSAKYLEQTLPAWNNANRVYVFGPKMQGTISIKESDGSITAVLPSLGNTSVGFHLNANPNKEAGTTPASWTRHNYYVLHNRIYYKADGGGVSAPAMSRGIEFVPVIFDDEEEQKEMNPNGTMEVVGDGCIYDLMGRKVATREQVEDGSWWNQATPGVYILNGRKVIKK